MSADRERLARLRDMAAMVLDVRSQTLRAETAKQEAIQAQLAALEAAPVDAAALWPAVERAAFGYEQWAAARRAELNVRLAAQKVACLQAEGEARLAFGRKSALDRLAERLSYPGGRSR